MSKTTYDVVATLGSYTTPEGKEKKHYQNCGFATKNEDGQIGIKLNAAPLSPDWNGWLNLYPKNNTENSKPRQESQRPKANLSSFSNNMVADDDDIPF